MVQLLIALALFIFFAPFVEEIKGGDLIVSILLSLVLISAVLAVAGRRSTLIIALLLAIPALVGRWINYFRPELVPPAVFLTAGLALIAFVVANLLRFVLRAPSVNADVTLRKHFSLSDARFVVDVSLLARGSVESGSLHLQHDQRNERDDGRFQRLLLQLHHAEHGRLWRYHPGFESRPYACGNRSHDRVALCRRFDFTVGLHFIQLQNLNDSYACPLGFLISVVNYSGECLSRFSCCGSGAFGATLALG